MASDKFGNNPVAPLYNATGRNPRDLDMGSMGKPLGSVGSSGAGGKDFGTPNRPAQSQPLGQGMLSPFNVWGPNSMYQTARKIGRGRGRGLFGRGEDDDSGDPAGSVYDESGRRVAVDAMERLKPTVNIEFAAQAGGNQDNRGMNAQIAEGGRQVIDAQYTEGGDNNSGITQTTTIEGTPPGAQPANTRKGVKRTEEQKAATAATRAEKRAANPNYGKRNPNRPERTQSPIARKPRSASAKSGNQPMTTATQRVSNITQTQTFGGNL